jgi:uroporphyrinogen III methyltransferase/synthase
VGIVNEMGPLAGRTVVVTRAAEQARRLVEVLEAAGARVLLAPTIAIEPPPSWEPLDHALDGLEGFTWAIFTSVNGVGMVDRRLRARASTWAGFTRLKVAAIGPATAQALAEHGVQARIVPEEFRAEGLVARLRGEIGPHDRIVLPRAAQTRDILVRELAALGAAVTEVPAYTTRPVEDNAATLRRALAADTVDAVTFTSSSTARNFAELFTPEERRAWLDRVVVACIGPVTAATAAEYGLPTHVMPREYTIPALVDALVQYLRQAGPRVARAASPGGGRSR